METGGVTNGRCGINPRATRPVEVLTQRMPSPTDLEDAHGPPPVTSPEPLPDDY
jgi:hypothetical protein